MSDRRTRASSAPEALWLAQRLIPDLANNISGQLEICRACGLRVDGIVRNFLERSSRIAFFIYFTPANWSYQQRCRCMPA
jgi:hypothetical protein